MEDLLLEPRGIRVEDYRTRSETAANSASRANVEDVAASYQRLAACWRKLAATVEAAGTAEERDAA